MTTPSPGPGPEGELQRSLGPLMIWGLGVGYVISGMYFGWNLGLPQGGPYGLLVATVLVTLMYVTFVMGYAELACAIPRAGGAFVYAEAAFGPAVGYLAGVAQCVEFVFAPPAIAAAIGAYFAIFVPSIHPLLIAALAYLLFTGLNVWGVKQSAAFELGVTVLAVVELLVFAGVTVPRFSWAAFTLDPLPNGWGGVLPAIPFAIWFYLAIEGVANVAEEARDPQKDLARGFGLAMATLVGLAGLTFFSAVGVAGWKAIVFKPGSSETSDSPLPLALAQVVPVDHPLYHMLIGIGLCGLVASFHGIILVAGRATLEMGRAGYAPRLLGRTLAGRKTPAAALAANTLVGLVALVSGKTAEIITISVYGALTLYVLATLSLLRLRLTRPDMPRPYRTPLYPWVPLLSLGLSLLSLVALVASDWHLAAVYAGLLGAGLAWFAIARRWLGGGHTATHG